MGEYTIKLDAVSSDAEGVGLKAARIGSMLAAGLPVPSGFVLNSNSLSKFLRHNKIESKIAGLQEESHSASFQKLREISGQIQSMIINGIMPDFIERVVREEYQDLSIGREAKEIGGAALDLIRAGRDNVFVTVRPSPDSGGIVSPNFTGQMKSVLCLRGYSKIIDAIKECWASLFSPRAMLYRKRKRIRQMPSMGVIVQKSLEPEKAGFAYTSIPETGDTGKVLIEGSWGFADSIISGAVSPDEYVMDKETGELEGKKIRKKTWMKKRNEMTGRIEREPVFRERVDSELLDGKEIRKIYEMCARVERHFSGHPQEIEWCEERGRIFLIDSLPVPDYGIPPSQDDAAGGPPGMGSPGMKSPGIRPLQGSETLARGICAYRGSLRGKARIISSMSDTERIGSGDIMVTGMTIPEMLPVMGKVSGMITDEGSRSCHAAVLAREFGIPCIVSAGNAMSTLSEDQEIILDATEGRAYSVPESPLEKSPPEAAWQQSPGMGQQMTHMGHPLQPGQFRQGYPESQVPDPSFQNPPDNSQIPPFNPPAPGGFAQKDSSQGIPSQGDSIPSDSSGGIYHAPGIAQGQGNQPQSGLPDDGITAAGLKAIVSVPGALGNSPEISDGAGLVRAEHLIVDKGKHPFRLVRQDPGELISSLASGLGSIAKAFYPKPVWYRSIDVRTDEFRELEGGEEEPSENNPLMGWHGIRRSLDQPDLLRIEIEVIRKLRSEGLGNIMLGIPFISGVDELRAVKRMAGPSVGVGIMVETPAAALEIEGFCREGIAFAAIGLNDLTQLTLGVDRENSMISKLYSEMNPAVMSLLKHILRTCRKHSVETSVYGDFVSDSRIAEALVGIGVGSITTEPENLESVRSLISRTERKLILESMRSRQGMN